MTGCRACEKPSDWNIIVSTDERAIVKPLQLFAGGNSITQFGGFSPREPSPIINASH
jgi:hypothetical protein